jgi:hypothetical protein
MSTATCHAFPIRTQQGSATTSTGTANSSMTSKRTKKQATSAPDVQDLVAMEKQTRTRNQKMASIWKKTLCPNPLIKLRLVLVGQTH